MTTPLDIEKEATLVDEAGRDNGAEADAAKKTDSRSTDAVDSLIERVLGAIDTSLHEWDARSTATLDDLKSQATDFASKHAAVVSESEIAKGDAQEAWQVIFDYSQRVNEQIVAPLVTHVKERLPGAEIGNAFVAWLSQMADLEKPIPDVVRLPEPPDLYVVSPGDSVTTSLRKAFTRSVRACTSGARATVNLGRRIIGRPPLPMTERTRIVQVKLFAAYHLRTRIPILASTLHNGKQQSAAQLMYRLEQSVSSWTHASLALERKAYSNRFGLDQAETWFTESLGEIRSDVEENLDETAAAQADDEDTTEIVDEFASISSRLQSLLEEVANLDLVDDSVSEDSLAAAHEVLKEDLRLAGTSLFRGRNREVADETYGLRAKALRLRDRWTEWHAEALDRIQLGHAVIALRKRHLESGREVVVSTARATMGTVFSAFQQLDETFRTAGAEAAQACELPTKVDDLEPLKKKLLALRRRVSRAVEHKLRTIPGVVSSDKAFQNLGEREWQAIEGFVQTCPAKFTIHEIDSPPTSFILPNVTKRTIPFKQAVAEALRVHTGGEAADAALALRREIVRMWGEAERMEEIVEYNIDAAINELDRALRGEALEIEEESESEDDDLEPYARAAKRAREFTEGLTRASQQLVELGASLREPWLDFAESILDEQQSAWMAFIARIRTGDSDEQRVHAWWTLALNGARRGWRTVVASATAAFTRLSRSLRIAQRRAVQIIRKGQTAVGAIEQREEDLVKALDAVAEVAALRKELPLVYRRLFAFEPLAETGMVEGRAKDIAWVKQNHNRWSSGQPAGAQMIVGPLGSGRTTVLNVVERELEDDCARISLTKRVLDESTLAKTVAEALNLPHDETVDLEELEERLSGSDRHVCLIDNFEHLILRAPGGLELAERMLLFMSRTDRSVYWLSTINQFAWNYLRSATPAAISFINAKVLEPLDRDGVKAIVLNRHRRSGMALHFVEQEVPRSRLKRFFGRSQSEEERQAASSAVYFDRLFRASGQSALLALFYWTSSAKFEEDKATVTISPFEPLRFGYVSRLDAPRAFSLAAFLLHNTLTAEEHNAAVRLSVDDGTMVMESLLNMRILEPAPGSRDDARHVDDGRVDPTDRYRIRPILVQPVTAGLTLRRIVY